MNSKTYKIENAMKRGTAQGFKVLAYAISKMEKDNANNGTFTCKKKELEDFYVDADSIIKRESGESIYDWMLVFNNPETGRDEAHQIITDAGYKDNELKIYFNSGLSEGLSAYQEYYSENLDKILEDEAYEDYLEISK